ncbi:branched-chain amino acid aminotransferase [Eisenibacter elegans]|jgi:branched-chain amino acid aminotransferase|uniref:branched-chain amino acid aminotransferase n=1 Tax=Eisenibacter elegans TaxID=997 RepID=UPI00047DA9D4|nr:branched-chain amino acid aminotransferase [Eisenibacter elegans]
MIDTLSIHIEPVAASRLPSVDFENLAFGRTFTDHMFMVDYKEGQWQQPRIVPYGNLPMSPATMGIHYAQSIFEGMKAYRSPEGKSLLFRPLENARRLNRSAERMCMPTLPEELFMEGLTQLLRLDRDWIPAREGYSLYIRPFMFAADEYVGLKVSDNYRFMIIASPVGSYYAAPPKVKIETKYVRAVKGGVGAAKTAGNYAASLYPAQQGRNEGYDQLVWTDGLTHQYIEESGTMNLFFRTGERELLTPTLTDGTILPGITRSSIIALAGQQGYTVTERHIKVAEVIEGLSNGTIQEAFGAGTAAVISPIQLIGYEGQQFPLRSHEEGSLALTLKQQLTDIQTGKAADPFGWVYEVV